MYFLINVSIFLLAVLVAIPCTNAVVDCPIQHPCNETKFTSIDVKNYCKVHHGAMSGRCCNFNNTIIGLDMQYCGMKELNISHSLFYNLEILDLRENDFSKFTSTDLIGLLKLVDLYLPPHISCPGGPNCWDEASSTDNMTFCSQQNDPCTSLNITCGEPENAHCKHIGPGSAKCECSNGYFGYKCLNRGEFPTTVFTCGVIIPTIVLSIALWFIQGRDPYKRVPPTS